jgi:Fe2+ or Zn2+ uptake regulation protein
MTKHSAFELEVLGRVAEDYEAPYTIADDISRDLERAIPEADVYSALLALARSGMVQAYAYDPQTKRYNPISAAEARTAKGPWFMATALGRSESERHAS